MPTRWLRRIAAVARWLFVTLAVLLILFGPIVAISIYSWGVGKYSTGFGTAINEITGLEHPSPQPPYATYYTHEQANAMREIVNDDYKRAIWETFSSPLIVLIVLAVTDITCRRIAKGRMDMSAPRLAVP